MDYFDHAASSDPSQRVRQAMEPWLATEYGNPSARHRAGVRAAVALDHARTQVARALGARESGVIFTSGGTEANNLALFGAARARRKAGQHVLLGPSEHPSVRQAGLALREEGYEVEFLRLEPSGALDLLHAQQQLRADTILVAQMLVQNEVGTIYPVAELARLVRRHAPAAHVHVDAVQALGKIELSLGALAVDSLSVSAHKVHGPRGAGALALAEKARLKPLLYGGGQERGLRSGSENTAAIVGMGVACEEAAAECSTREAALTHLRQYFVRGVQELAGLRLLEPGAQESGISPAIVALLVPGAPAEVWLHHLEEQGLYVGTGSACQSTKKEISPTFAALGLKPEDARAMLRFSFAAHTTRSALDRALRALAQATETLGSVRAG